MPFAERLLVWFDEHGRQNLPWQHPRSPYRVWLSEIMLQQTQVATVIPYFERFVDRFPDVAELAAAPADEVLKLWAGLGYYARARNLHAAARQIAGERGGAFPQDLDGWLALPGIGRSTAGAILAQAYGQRQPILDGNVRRLLARHGAVAGWPGEPAVQARLWRLAEAQLPDARLTDYTQAMMDLGSLICSARTPVCGRCPVAEDCEARRQNRIADFPAPRPRRKRPQRSAWLLLIEDADGRLLLERRPPAGLWGGLWCPPVVIDADWRQHGPYAGIGEAAALIERLPSLQHSFTHFDLRLSPLRLRAGAMPAQLREAGAQQWVKLDAQTDAGHVPGLPSPIRRLLLAPRQDTIALEDPT
jgi:A/G-specific adenine glycosylase